MKERRILNPNDVQLRAFKDEEGKMYIEGYAAVFGKRSKLIMDWDGIYYEQIERGAFDNVLSREDLDVLMTINHNFEAIPVARTRAGKGTLILEADDTGLKYTAEVANTSAGRDLFESVSRGDIDSNSFVFTVAKDRWQYMSEEGYDLRFVEEVDNLYDVSAVNFPAYPDAKITEVDTRSLKEFKDKSKTTEDENDEKSDATDDNEVEIMRMQINLIKKK
jgi:hypothetical protein